MQNLEQCLTNWEKLQLIGDWLPIRVREVAAADPEAAMALVEKITRVVLSVTDGVPPVFDTAAEHLRAIKGKEAEAVAVYLADELGATIKSFGTIKESMN